MGQDMKAIVLLGLCILTLVMASLLVGEQSVTAMPGEGTLYATSGSRSLLTIDKTTGLSTTVGLLPMVVPAIAIHPTTGVLYAGGGGGSPFLLKLNKSNAATTIIGDTALGLASISDMDFSPNGTLFASVNIVGDGGTGGDHLATINVNTGLATIVGPFGMCTGVVVPTLGAGSCSVEGMEGLAYSQSGTLYATHTLNSAAGQPGLYTVNPATGTATFVAPILNAAGQPPAGGIASIRFGCNGTLYGGTTRLAANNGGNLVAINPVTGIFTNLGVASSTDGSALAALAFDNNSCVADMAITKTSNLSGPVASGTTITYTLTVTNNGPGTAMNVVVSDSIPANTTFDSLSQISGPMFTVQAPASGGAGVILLTTASMPSSQSAIFSISLRVSKTTPGMIVNTATVTNSINDSNLGNNSASVSTASQSPATSMGFVSQELPPPPYIPQIFQNPAVQGIVSDQRSRRETPVVLASTESPVVSGALIIHPPHTGEAGLCDGWLLAIGLSGLPRVYC